MGSQKRVNVTYKITGTIYTDYGDDKILSEIDLKLKLLCNEYELVLEGGGDDV